MYSEKCILRSYMFQGNNFLIWQASYRFFRKKVKRNEDTRRTAAEVKVAVAFWWTIIEAGILMFFLWKGWRLGWSKHEVKPAAFPDCITSSPWELGHPNTKVPQRFRQHSWSASRDSPTQSDYTPLASF